MESANNYGSSSSEDEDDALNDLMMNMMMMNLSNKKKKENSGADVLLQSLQQQNAAIEKALRGEPEDQYEDDIVGERLKMLEDKLVSGYKQAENGSDGFFNEDMMSMLLLNMQSSMQMMPYITMRQQQQQKANSEFKNYVNQMQALNSMLHTLSYGTPLSQLNQMHEEVKEKYQGYNQRIEGQLQDLIHEARDLREEEDRYDKNMGLDDVNEDDVIAKLEQSMRRSKGNIKQAVSDTLSQKSNNKSRRRNPPKQLDSQQFQQDFNSLPQYRNQPNYYKEPVFQYPQAQFQNYMPNQLEQQAMPQYPLSHSSKSKPKYPEPYPGQIPMNPAYPGSQQDMASQMMMMAMLQNQMRQPVQQKKKKKKKKSKVLFIA